MLNKITFAAALAIGTQADMHEHDEIFCCKFADREQGIRATAKFHTNPMDEETMEDGATCFSGMLKGVMPGAVFSWGAYAEDPLENEDAALVHDLGSFKSNPMGKVVVRGFVPDSIQDVGAAGLDGYYIAATCQDGNVIASCQVDEHEME